MTTAVVNALKRFAVHDGPGIRTTVFLKGCPLHCLWCHNPEGISPRAELAFYRHKCTRCGRCARVCPSGAHHLREGVHTLERTLCTACGLCAGECPAGALQLFGRTMTEDEVLLAVLEDRIFYKTSGGGVTVSGGEPLLQSEFCRALFARLQAEEIHTAADTCGAVSPEAIRRMMDVTDLFLYDIKHMDPEEHRRLTGMDNVRILENLRMLDAGGASVEIRMPLIPGCNDSPAHLRDAGRFLASLSCITRVKVLPYHSYARSKYEALDLPDTMPETASPGDPEVENACTLLREYGIRAIAAKDA